MTHGTDPKSSTFFKKLGIIVGFVTGVITEIFSKMTDAELQFLSEEKKDIRSNLESIFNLSKNYIVEREKWRKFYLKYFGIAIPWSIRIPDKPKDGSWRLLIININLTHNDVFNRMSESFLCWKSHTNLDSYINKNIRDTNLGYAIWVRDNVEPDEKYLGKFASEVDPNMVLGVTLLEHMIHHLVYFDETGKHLDIEGVTLCSGSRNRVGDIPRMRIGSGIMGGGEVIVGWCSIDNSGNISGIREAVS